MASWFPYEYDPWFPYEYDPYDPWFPYEYDPYYQRQPAPTRRSKAAAAKPTHRARDTKTSFSIPVHGADSAPEPEPQRKRKAARERAEPVAPAMSAEEAAVRMQAAARGFLARKSVLAVREVQREVEKVRAKMASEAEALVAYPRARLAAGEALMRMLLRLDAVRGGREFRRRVIKRALALQDAIDALDTEPALAPTPAPVGQEEAEVDAPDANAVKMAEESAAAQEMPDAAEGNSKTESIQTAVHTHTQMEVDEAIATGEPEAEELEQGVREEQGAGEEQGAVLEGEWEMVTENEDANEDTRPGAATSGDKEAPRKEPECLLETMRSASTGAASDGVDPRKVMEMVAALCEQSAQQCAVISALAERVDALERTVRRMEDTESCRQRAAKRASEASTLSSD